MNDSEPGDVTDQLFSIALENKSIRKFIYGYAIFNALILFLLIFLIFIYLKNIHV